MKNKTHDKDLFQNIFEASAEGTIAVHEDGLILVANSACEQLFGYPSGGLVGEDLEILIPEKLKLPYKSYIKNQTSLPENETGVWGVKKNGEKISLNISLRPTVNKGENATIVFFRDNTQHKNDLRIIKQTNTKLIESNRKFDALINNQKGILFRCKNNRNYEMDYISEGCLQITGYPFKDFKNQTITYGKLILTKDREHVWESIQRAIKQKKQYDFEYRIQHKDGSIKYVWEKGEAIYNDQNEVVILEGFITEITPQKETELELRSSEAKIKALLKAIPDIMFIQDHKGNFLDWYTNKPEKLFMPSEEFIGVNMEKVLSPKVYQKIKSSHNKVIESGKIQVAEYSVHGKEGIENYEARVVLMSDCSLLTIIRDTTEKKATDALLNIRNNALASAINSIVIVDAQQPHAPIIYCNRAFEEMTGYSTEEILGRNCQFLQNDDRDQKEIETMRNAIANGEACNVIVRNYKKDKTLFWNDVTITPVRNEDNVLTHFIGVQNDVTDKVKAENLKEQIKKILELIARDKPLKTISNKIVTTIETHIRDSMASIFLLDSENDKFHKLVAPNIPPSFSNYIENATIIPELWFSDASSFLEKNIIFPDISKHILWKDYKEIALKNGIKASWSFPIISSTKKVLGIFAVFNRYPRKPSLWEKQMILDMIDLINIAIEKDITTTKLQENKIHLKRYTQKLEERVKERTEEVMATVQKLVETNFNLEDQILKAQQAEKLAKTSKGIASQIAKNFPNGFIAVMDKDLKIQFAGGEGLVQLGLEKIFYEGMSVYDISNLSKVRKTLIEENVLKTLSGRRLSFEVNYKNRYFAVNTIPMVNENNEISNALHVYNDISQQKEIEFTIQNSLKKERELNELKSRFVSMASHEFRTPLSAILTSAILIGKQNEPGKELKREKYVTQIERNVNNLSLILNDFLSLSKLEEGKIVALPERFDLISFAKELVQETSISLKKGQTISVTAANDQLFLHLDVKLLRHILNNLLSNASKYSPEESIIDFKIFQKQNSVILQITDKGIGIPKEEQKHLFSRFFRAKNALNLEGTGLGLNIVKHYTELMGGTVEFESEINRGATFWVEFPK